MERLGTPLIISGFVHTRRLIIVGDILEAAEKFRLCLFHRGHIARLATPDDRQCIDRASIGLVELGCLGVAKSNPVSDGVAVRQIGTGDWRPPAIGYQRTARIWGRDDRRRADTSRAKQHRAERDRQAHPRPGQSVSHGHFPW